MLYCMFVIHMNSLARYSTVGCKYGSNIFVIWTRPVGSSNILYSAHLTDWNTHLLITSNISCFISLDGIKHALDLGQDFTKYMITHQLYLLVYDHGILALSQPLWCHHHGKTTSAATASCYLLHRDHEVVALYGQDNAQRKGALVGHAVVVVPVPLF